MNRAILFRGSASAGLALVFMLSSPAIAGEWQIKPRIEVREGFTDNVLLTNRNKKTDFFTTVSPGIGVAGQGARIKFDLDLALNYDAYLRESSLNGFRQDLRGFGTITLLENSLFLDVNGFAGQSPTVGRGQTSAVDRRVGGNQTGGDSQFYSYGLSPYWRSGLGSWGTSEVRYRFNQVFSKSNNSTSTIATSNSGLLSDTTVHQFTGFVQSGENFNRLRWRGSADVTNSESTGGTGANSSREFKRRNVDFQPSYVVNRWLTLLGTIGYETIDSAGFSQKLSGTFWNVGFRLTPSERTNFELTYGDRYNGQNWASSFSTTLDAGTTMSFSYRETVETQALQALSNFGFLQRDATTGQLVDRRTGLPFNGRDPNFDQNDQTFLSKAFILSLSLPRERNTYLLSAQHTIRDSQIASVTPNSGRSDKSIGLTASWTHQLTPVLSSTATANYTNSTTDSGGNSALGKSKTFRGEFSLRYEMNPSLNATAGIAHIQRDISGPQFFSNEFSGAYSENVAFLTLRKTF